MAMILCLIKKMKELKNKELKMKRFLIPVLIGIFLWSCSSTPQKPKNKVLFVSILPLKYFADKIAGDEWKVEVTVPPGAGPETYSPTPKQIMLLGEAQAYFSIGYLGFEQAWLENFRSSNPQLQLFPTSKRIDLIKDEHHEGEHQGDHVHLQGVDPHIWSSPKTVRLIAQNIFDGMMQIDPANGDTYQKNLNVLLAEIQKVDSTVTQLLSRSSSKKFIIFHPALGYFARDYGFEQLSIEFEGKIPSPKHLQTVIETAKSNNIKFILIQKEFDTENAEIIARETGSKIVQIDPLDYNWPGQMIEIAKKLAETPQ
jgi:zinc transport system substrate-binding protein